MQLTYERELHAMDRAKLLRQVADTHASTRALAHVHKRHTGTHKHTHTRAHTHTRTHTHVHMDACARVRVHCRSDAHALAWSSALSAHCGWPEEGCLLSFASFQDLYALALVLCAFAFAFPLCAAR